MPNDYNDIKKNLLQGYFKTFNSNPDYYFLSPGRLEIIGNHTDHNHGLAIVASASIYIKAACSYNDTNKIILHSKGFGQTIEVSIVRCEPNPNNFSTTYSLINGIINGFLSRGYKVGGVNIYCESDILIGSGISSSAAFELLICTIINKIFNGNKIDKMTLVHISQESEKFYFGKPCGLLDQIGCAFGGLSMVDFNDPENPIVKNIIFPFNDLKILLTNPGGSHAGLDDYYASIPNDMYSVAKRCGEKYLRDVGLARFYKMCENKNNLSELQIQRANHFFNECCRVKEAYKAITNNDEKLFLKMINESGLSSSFILKNTFVLDRYENSPEKALKIARKIAPRSGHRVHGGGFMGTIISFMNDNDKEIFVKHMNDVFGNNSVIETKISPFGSTDI